MKTDSENQCIIQHFSRNDFYSWVMAYQYLRSTDGVYRRLVNAISSIRNASYVDAQGFLQLLALNRQRKSLQFHRHEAKSILLAASTQIEKAISEGAIITFDLSRCTPDQHFFRWLNKILQILPANLQALDVFEPVRDCTVSSLDELVDQHDSRLVLIQLSNHVLTQTEKPEQQLSLAQLASRGYGLSTPFTAH